MQVDGRQGQFVAHHQESGGDDAKQGYQGGYHLRDAQVQHHGIGDAAHHADGRIDLAVEDQGDFVAQQVAHHAAEAGGQSAQTDAQHGTVPPCEADLYADDRIYTQTDGVEKEQRLAQVLEVIAEQHRHRHGNEQDVKVRFVVQPEYRSVDQHVADRSSGKRRAEGDDEHAEHIHAFLHGGQGARNGESPHPGKVEDGQQLPGIHRRKSCGLLEAGIIFRTVRPCPRKVSVRRSKIRLLRVGSARVRKPNGKTHSYTLLFQTVRVPASSCR